MGNEKLFHGEFLYIELAGVGGPPYIALLRSSFL